MKFESTVRSNTIYQWLHNVSSVPTHYYTNPFSYAFEEAYEFDTLGDGKVQHTPRNLVTSAYAEDFCISMAFHLESHPEEAEELSYTFSIVNKGLIKFAAKVKYKEEKPQRYYDLESQKISSSQSKSFDKRFKIIPTWADGSVYSVLRLLRQSYWSYCACLIAVEEIRRAMDYAWFDYHDVFGVERQELNLLIMALRVIQLYSKAHSAMDVAKRSAESLHYNTQIRNSSTENLK